MKKLFNSIILLILMTGCNNDGFNESISTLEIQAPNGEYIAKSIDDLNIEIEKIVASQYGEDLKFDITSIDYTPLDEGYLANITYKVANGFTHNLIRTNNANILGNSKADKIEFVTIGKHKIMKESERLVLTNSSSRSGRSATHTYVCKSASNCSPCQVQATITQPTAPGGQKDIKISCTDTCSDCKLEVTIIEQ